MTIPHPEAPRILIVDDEPSDRHVLAAVLHRPVVTGGDAPYEFHFACGGTHGLAVAAALAEAGGPVVVCCDLVMPEMDGLEFCLLLRRDPATRALPLLAMTCLDDAAVRADLLAAGADAVVLKPFDAAEVRGQVRELARRIP